MNESLRYHNLVATVMSLLEARNPFNLDHCKLVAHYADATAARVGLDEAARDRLRVAAELHTLGVLLQLEEKKPNADLPVVGTDIAAHRTVPTHEREVAILRSILAGMPGLDASLDIIIHRHEWFDGSGSLLGLAGKAISPEARVLAVADAFVDLATPKSHRAPVSLTEVLRGLREGAGTQFDPVYVDELSRYVLEEEERWGASARARRLEVARCRHWLSQGHFYRQSRDTEWALRSYKAAETLAEGIGETDLILECVSGQFLVYCDMADLDRAGMVLNRVRSRSQETTGWARQWYLMQWGILEWMRGSEENGEQIVSGVLSQFVGGQNLNGEAAAMAVLSHMALMRRGADDPTHLRLLRSFVDLLVKHDLFDVVVGYRPQTIPLLLSALVHDLQPALARNLLTRVGEPCPGKFVKTLAKTPPQQWLEVLHPGAVTAPTPLPAATPLNRRATDPGYTPQTTGGTPRRRANESDTPQVHTPNLPLRVLLMGAVRLEADGKQATEDDWPTQKAMKLFVFLTTRSGRSASDQVLMEMFWPLVEEDKARNSLRNAVHQIRSVLRNLLGDEVANQVLTRSRRTGTLTVQMDAFVDTDILDEAVKHATTLVAQGKHAAALALLKGATHLYRGHFVENVRDDWALALRTRTADTYLKALDLQARCLQSQGDLEGAEMAARRALACDELQEDGHVNLIEALVGQNRRTEALRHYQQAVTHFKKEMGLEAPARMASTYERLLG